MKFNTKSRIRGSDGFVMVGVLIFIMIASIAIAGWLKLSSASLLTTHATKIRTKNFGSAEATLSSAIGWVRSNSQNMTQLFSQANFCNNFALYANASFSTNDASTGNFPVATRIKIKNTNDSPLLIRCGASNCTGLGTSSFPNSTFYGTSTTFNTQTQFNALNIGTGILKVTLVDAVPVDLSASSTTCPSPTTDFFPVYRIDAMTDNASGSRVFGYVTGSLSYNDAVGFYGTTSVLVKQPCASDHFTGSTPDDGATGAFHAKCGVGSQGNISFDTNWKSKIFGSAKTSGGSVDASNVCSTYSSTSHSCIAQGTACPSYIGESCTVSDPFSGLTNPFLVGDPHYCSGAGLGNITAGSYSGATLSLATPGCYNSVLVANNKTLNLTSPNTANPPAYYFQTLNVGGGSGSLAINPNPSTARVELHIKSMIATGETAGCNVTINANNAFNVNNTKLPSQFKVIYWGICDVKFNGNSKVAMTFFAPNANVTVTGSSDYYGAIYAKTLTLTGSGKVLYDESLGGSVLIDSTYKLRNMEETYR